MPYQYDHQEMHQNVEEYCRRSGPLNSRKITGAKANKLQKALFNGLKLVAAAGAAVGVIAAAATLYVSCTANSILTDEATINVKAFNHKEEVIQFVLNDFGNGKQNQSQDAQEHIVIVSKEELSYDG